MRIPGIPSSRSASGEPLGPRVCVDVLETASPALSGAGRMATLSRRPYSAVMLRILTLNIQGDEAAFGAWPERRRRILALFEAMRPHVVALQAVRVAKARDQVAELTAQSPYRHSVSATAGETELGVAILSTIPLRASWSLALPRGDDGEDTAQRRALVAQFAWQGEVWRFANAHCSWVPAQNVHQVRALMGALARYSGPQCLAGDFNAAPASPGIRRLLANGWMDSFALKGRGASATFPANAPRERIDFLFLQGVVPGRVRDVRIACGFEPLSDHNGVLLTLEPAKRNAKPIAATTGDRRSWRNP